MTTAVLHSSLTDKQIDEILSKFRLPYKTVYGTYDYRYVYKQEPIITVRSAESSESDNDSLVYLPFHYGKSLPKNVIKIDSALHVSTPTIDSNESTTQFPKFTGTLRPHQKKIYEQILTSLNTSGCALLGAQCGFGKCFALDTQILTFDGQRVLVQDIVVGDQLMGDDQTPREVLSTCFGQEQMYSICLENGDQFVCNESHVLTLQNTITKNIRNISVRDFLSLEPNEQTKFRSIKRHITTAFSESNTPLSPYDYGLLIARQQYALLNDNKCRTENSIDTNELYERSDTIFHNNFGFGSETDKIAAGTHSIDEQSNLSEQNIITTIDEQYLINSVTKRLQLLKALTIFSSFDEKTSSVNMIFR